MLVGASRPEGIWHNHRAPMTKWTENKNNIFCIFYMLNEYKCKKQNIHGNYSDSVSMSIPYESKTIGLKLNPSPSLNCWTSDLKLSQLSLLSSAPSSASLSDSTASQGSSAPSVVSLSDYSTSGLLGRHLLLGGRLLLGWALTIGNS